MTTTANLWTVESVVREWIEKRDLSRRKIAFLENAYKQLFALAGKGEWTPIPDDIVIELKITYACTWGLLVMKILEKVSPKFNSFVDGVVDIETRQWEHGYVDDLLLDMENEEEFDPDRDSWDLEELIVNWHELKHAKKPRWEPRLSDMRLDFLERVFQEVLKISSDQEPEGDSNLASMVDDDRCKFVPQVVAWVLDDQRPGKAPSRYEQITKAYLEAGHLEA